MKNKLLAIFVFASALLAFSGCEEDSSAGYTRITYYPTIELLGDQVIFIDKGTTFADPGVKAELNGEDFADKVKVISTLNTNKPGFYTITYVATNEDGFSASVSRSIIVYDSAVTADISGTYSVDAINSYRFEISNSAKIVYSNLVEIYGKGDFSKYTLQITKVTPGCFFIQDFFGGYYTEGRGYDSIFEMQGYVLLDNNYNISLLTSKVEGWGDSLNKLENASFDPMTGILKWSAYYANKYSFNVVLNKIN